MKDWYESLMGWPNTHWAGERLVLGSGVLRYCRMASWRESVSRVPCASVLSVMRRFMVFTPISARQLECGKSHGAESVMDAPFPQECAGGTCCEFRPTVGGAFIWDAEGGEQSSKGVNQAFGPLMRSFDDWPVGVSVGHNEVVHSFVGEEVRTDALKRVGQWDWWVGECAWL